MIVPVTVPKAGLTMTEGIIEKWLIEVGSTVQAGQVVAELSTEKVTVEVHSPVSGVISEICFSVGNLVKVGDTIAKVVSETVSGAASGGTQPVRSQDLRSDGDSVAIQEHPVDWDAVVIGGGPGGYVAALRVAQLGGKVVLIEKEKVGGTCLHKGCIPTKALIRTAEVYRMIKMAGEFGVEADLVHLRMDQAYRRKDSVVEKLHTGVEQLLRKANVTLITGTAEVVDGNTVKVTKDGKEESIRARNIVIATGSKPKLFSVDGAHDDDLWTSEDLLKQPVLPKTLVVIGGGYIGMEFASLFSSLGTKVTIVEAEDKVLASLDAEITQNFVRILKKEKVELFTGSRVLRMEKSPEGKTLVIHNKKAGEIRIQADIILSAVGRIPCLPKMGSLEHLVVQGALPVDTTMRTAAPTVYAIGDVTGGLQLAHVASAQALVAAERIMGLESEFSPLSVPAGIFTNPEIAYVGLTEEEARARGLEYHVGKFPLAANGRALSIGETAGFVKVIAGKPYGEILGVHILGADAVNLIAEAALAISLEATLDELIHTIHVHPTLSETLAESAMIAAGRPLHIH